MISATDYAIRLKRRYSTFKLIKVIDKLKLAPSAPALELCIRLSSTEDFLSSIPIGKKR